MTDEDLERLFRENVPILNMLPFPVYCTEWDTGKIVFANAALADLSGYDINDLVAGLKNAESLYADRGVRLEWKERLRESDGPVVSHFQFIPQKPGQGVTRPHLIDVAKRFGKYAVGALVDVTTEWDEHTTSLKLLENKIATYREILDLKWINVGVHEVDEEGQIAWMNECERQLLKVDREWIDRERPHVSLLSPPGMRGGIVGRVHQKIAGTLALIAGEDRKFCTRPDRSPEDPASTLVPVNLHDFGILEPDPVGKRRLHSGLVTTVRDERIPTDVTSILREFGPRNPLLERLGVCTFIKVQRRHAYRFSDAIPRPPDGATDNPDQLVFTYGNEPFEREVMALSRARKTKVPIVSSGDILGKTEVQLFGDYAPRFWHADRDVMAQSPRESEGDQRIEKHPGTGGEGPIDVQVFKIPAWDPDDPEVCVGVQGFYWHLTGKKSHDRLNEIREHLEQFYSPAKILNSIPAPVYREDDRLRFLYCNSAYIKDINLLPDEKRNPSFPKVCRIHDIIGRTDRDIFTEKDASDYEAADREILEGKVPEISRVERHGSGNVRVIKTAIWERDAAQPPSIVGVQGIYWSLTPEDTAALREDVSIDWKWGLLYLKGREEPLRIEVHSGERWWYLFDYLWSNLRRPVSYADIAREAFKDAGLAGQLESGDAAIRRSARELIQQRKRGLLRKLNELGLASSNGSDSTQLFWFPRVDDGYYQMDSRLGEAG